MNYLVEKVSEYMQQNHMVEEGQKIVVGVSGGADSMGLLFVRTPSGSGGRHLRLYLSECFGSTGFD